MKKYTFIILFFCCFVSCKTKEIVDNNAIQLFIPDTINNIRAQQDRSALKYLNEIEIKLGLRDLQKGADSFEIRYWYDFSFSNAKDLYSLKFVDTFCTLTYSRIYLREIDFENANRIQEWNPYTNPIIDSTISKSCLIPKAKLNLLFSDSIWNLKSQSELNIPKDIGFTDCYTYMIEVADKKRFKFLRYHCPNSYYDKTHSKETLQMMNFVQRIKTIAQESNVVTRCIFE